MSNSIMAKLDNNFNIISTYSFNPYSLPITVFQNLEVYNEKLFLVYNDKLTIYDINGTMIKSIAMDSSIETDGFVSISGGNFLVGKIYQSALNNTFIHKNTIHQFNIFDSGLINPFLNIQGCVKTNGNISIVNGVNFITKRDHTVYCNICFQGLTSLSSQTVIAKLPQDFCPSHYISVICARSGHNFARFEIGTDGSIKVTASSSTSVQSSDWFLLDTTFIKN